MAAVDKDVVLGEGLVTDGFGVPVGELLFRTAFGREGGCTGACVNGCTKLGVVVGGGGGAYSGKGSVLNTSSKRARKKFDSSAKPRYAGVVSNNVIRAALDETCLKCSRFNR